jgi:hypothetical protein
MLFNTHVSSHQRQLTVAIRQKLSVSLTGSNPSPFDIYHPLLANRAVTQPDKLPLMNLETGKDDAAAKHRRSGGGRPFHSRLEPFVNFIHQQRQRRKTWNEIAALLGSQKGCAITAQGVHQFYRRHLQRRAKSHWEDANNPPESEPFHPIPQVRPLQPRSSPLPAQTAFKRPDREQFNPDEFV